MISWTVACQAPLWCKMLSNSITCYREIIRERKSQSMLQISLLSLRNCDTDLNLCNRHPNQSAAIHNGGKTLHQQKNHHSVDFGLVIYFILFFFLLHQAVRGILVPCPRIKIVFHVVEAQSLNEWTTRVHLHLLESAGDGQHF